MKVEVACRIRPRLEALGETTEISVTKKVDDSTLTMVSTAEDQHAERKSTFTFTYVFDEEDAQTDIYDDACVQLIDSTLDGHNATLLAYGQTGSGKTHTILGDVDPQSNTYLTPRSGIFLRAMNDLLAYKHANQETAHVIIGLSIVEVYNDVIRDLLIPAATPKILNDNVVGVGRDCVKSIRDVHKAFMIANEHRAVSSTSMNDRSSRSHAIFMVDILQQEKTKNNPDPPAFDDRSTNSQSSSNGLPIKKSRISLVDLAGSERLKRSHAEGKALVEAQNINKSLSALGNVVNALYEGHQHVPYRDSTLTKLLRQSFQSESSKVLLIANTSPAESSFVETQQTLRFADRIMQLDSPAKFSFDVVAEVEYMSQLHVVDELCADVRIAQAAEDYELQVMKRRLQHHKQHPHRRYKWDVHKLIADYKVQVETEGDKVFKQLLNKYLHTRRVVERRALTENQIKALHLSIMNEDQVEADVLLDFTNKQESIDHYMKYQKQIRTLRKNLSELKPTLEELLTTEKQQGDAVYLKILNTTRDLQAQIDTCKELMEVPPPEPEPEPRKEDKTKPKTDDSQPPPPPTTTTDDSPVPTNITSVLHETEEAHFTMLDDGTVLANRYQPSVPTEQELRDEENAPVCDSIVHRADVDAENLKQISDMLGNVLKPRHVHIAPVSSGEIRSFMGHDGAVYSCDFYKTGEMFASASRDKTLRVWQTDNGVTQQLLSGHSGYVLSCHFNPTSSHLASCSEDRTVKIWDATEGKKLSTYKGHNETVYCVQHNQAGTLLASASKDKTIKIWDIMSGKKIQTLKGHGGSVFCAAFSPDGTKLISSANDKQIKIWDISTFKEQLSFTGHDTTVWSCCFSNDSSKFLSSSQDNSMKLFNLDGTEVRSFISHVGPVYHAVFSPDGTKIISASGDKTLKIWDAQGRVTSTLVGHNRTIYHAAVYNSLILSCSDTVVKAWRLK